MGLGQSPVLCQDCLPTGGVPEALALDLPLEQRAAKQVRWGAGREVGATAVTGCKCTAHYVTEFRREGKTLHWGSRANGNPNVLFGGDAQWEDRLRCMATRSPPTGRVDSVLSSPQPSAGAALSH